MEHSYADYALLLKVISDETRLKVIDMLYGNELCACDILKAFSITQPTLSHHMKKLHECELVNVRKDGSWMKYTLNTEKYEQLLVFMKEIKKIRKIEINKDNCK